MMTSRRTICLLLCGLLGAVLCSLARSADWPQWRGPQRSGTSTETGWNTDWRKKPPTLLWEKTVGDGVSLPVVVDGKVYVFGLIDGSKDEIRCLALADGKTLWRRTVDTIARKRDNQVRGTISTPTARNGRLFTYHRTHELRCSSMADGSLLWKVNLLKRYGLCSSKRKQSLHPPSVLGSGCSGQSLSQGSRG